MSSWGLANSSSVIAKKSQPNGRGKSKLPGALQECHHLAHRIRINGPVFYVALQT